MPQQVLPLLFVNTPSVKQLWEEEHGKEVDSVLTEEEGKEVAAEYDQVSGNEGFYQLFIKHSATGLSNKELFTGNEGFWDGIKKGVDYVIDSIKKFFKWVYSFFTSKKELVERTKSKLIKVIDVKGVKEGNVAYPKLVSEIWNAPGKPGNNLSWISPKITEIDKVIQSSIAYKDALKHFVEEVTRALKKHGQIQKAKPDLEGFITTFNTKTKNIFKEGSFLANTVLSVNGDSRIVLKRNKAIPQKPITGSYVTDVSTVKTILKTVEHTNEEYGALTAEFVKLEDVLIKNMEATLRTGTNFSDGEEAGAKAVTDKVKKVTNMAMFNIKTLQHHIYKSINSALAVVKAAVPADTTTKE